MEEADFLGDTVAIMHQSRLRASGSSLFLKGRFGKGHTINLLSTVAATRRVEAIIREDLPGGEIISSAAGNISVSLPARAVRGIPHLFKKLLHDEQLVSEWGISNTYAPNQRLSCMR